MIYAWHILTDYAAKGKAVFKKILSDGFIHPPITRYGKLTKKSIEWVSKERELRELKAIAALPYFARPSRFRKNPYTGRDAMHEYLAGDWEAVFLSVSVPVYALKEVDIVKSRLSDWDFGEGCYGFGYDAEKLLIYGAALRRTDFARTVIRDVVGKAIEESLADLFLLRGGYPYEVEKLAPALATRMVMAPWMMYKLLREYGIYNAVYERAKFEIIRMEVTGKKAIELVRMETQKYFSGKKSKLADYELAFRGSLPVEDAAIHVVNGKAMEV